MADGRKQLRLNVKMATHDSRFPPMPLAVLLTLSLVSLHGLLWSVCVTQADARSECPLGSLWPQLRTPGPRPCK